MSERKPPTPAQRIQRAKDTIDNGGSPAYAQAHALIAIAELLQANIADAFAAGTVAGAQAATEVVRNVIGTTS